MGQRSEPIELHPRFASGSRGEYSKFDFSSGNRITILVCSEVWSLSGKARDGRIRADQKDTGGTPAAPPAIHPRDFCEDPPWPRLPPILPRGPTPRPTKRPRGAPPRLHRRFIQEIFARIRRGQDFRLFYRAGLLRENPTKA